MVGNFSSPLPVFALPTRTVANSEISSADDDDDLSNPAENNLPSIFDGFFWTALPKKRVSVDRRRMRRHGPNKIEKYATPRSNLIACLECGHWHMAHTICGM